MRYAGTLTGAVLAVLYLLLDPQSADLAAQLFRSGLFVEHGFAIYNPQWYAGHHLPGYSLLSPPLMAFAGPQAAGAAAAVLAACSFERIAHRFRPSSTAATLAACWFAVAITATGLVTGRITFTIGAALAIGAAALAGSAGRRGRALAPVAGVAAGLASPVAAALLAIAMAVWASTAPRARGIAAAVGVAAVAPAAMLLLAFPTGGSFPFALSSLLPTLGATAILWLALPADQVLLRRAVLAIGALVLVSGLASTAMGGNATRPATLLAGSIAALGLWPGHRRRLLLLTPLLLYWQLYPAADDWIQARGDRATGAAYYAPLRAKLRALSAGAPVRVEVPFSDNHWESLRLTDGAPEVLLARGWERQLDRRRNPLFYEDGLDDERYADWLREHAVSYVALPDAPLDYSAAREAALIRRRPGYLREIWSSRHWRLFQVLAPLPLVDGGRMAAAVPDRLEIVAGEPGQVLVRSAYSPYFEVAGARRQDPVDRGGWIVFCAPRPGRYVLEASLAARLRTNPGPVSGDCALR